MHNPLLKYRADIDGLRAVAVLAVVIYHFNREWLPGGFIGVDIFFVISGFLITGIIDKEMQRGEFSFVNFYIRRARRILPAALTTILLTLLVGYALLLPQDLRALAESAVAASASLANLYFWLFLDTSYFAPSSDSVSLLHMWSLGVEEQFYLIWPAVLLLLQRQGNRLFLLASILTLALLSFILGEYWLSRSPGFAYYMLPARAGELLAGSLLFILNGLHQRGFSQRTAEFIATSGTALLAWSLLGIREDDGFPGLIAIIPAVGTVLIIAAGQQAQTSVGRLLAYRPMVRLGLMSFSLYLWHWPVLAFYRYILGEPDLSGGLLCVAIIAILTVFSYYCIERPFRYPRQTVVHKAVMVVVPGVLIALVALVISVDGILPGLHSKKIEQHLDATKPAYEFEFNCQMAKFDPGVLKDSRCILGPRQQKPKILIIGDSNAAHYVGYLKVIAEARAVTMQNLTHSACVPFARHSDRYVSPQYADSCRRYNQAIGDIIGDYKVLFIAASWPTYAGSNKQFFADFSYMLEQLAKRVPHVVVGLKAPIFKGYDRFCELKNERLAQSDCQTRASYTALRDTATNTRITAIAARYANVEVFSLKEFICPAGKCSAYIDGTPLYFDPGHLSMAGSERIGHLALQHGKTPAALTP